MKKIALICSCLFAAVLLQAQTGDAGKTQWNTQQDTSFHFSFQYPGDWTLKLPGTNTRFFVTTKPENENDKFKENINCIVRVLEDPDFKVKDAEADVKESLKSQMPGFNLLTSVYKKWNGADALCLDYTTTQKSGDNTFNVHIYQQLAVLKGTLFVFTYTAESSGFSKYWDTVSKIIVSVKPAP